MTKGTLLLGLNLLVVTIVLRQSCAFSLGSQSSSLLTTRSLGAKTARAEETHARTNQKASDSATNVATEKFVDDEFVRQAFEMMDENPYEKDKSALLRPSKPKQQPTQEKITGKHTAHLHYESLPFSLIVGQDLIKRALLIAAVDPSLSVLLYGPKGTCKSVLARALHPLLPYENDNPVPKVHIPLHCQEDALVGTVDLERSLVSGQAVLEPGLLHKAHQGLLIIDDVQLLEPELTHILWNAVDSRQVSVEREGMSAAYPCRPLAIATLNPQEGGDDTIQCWVDRIAMRLPVSTSLAVEDRVHVVQHMESFLDHMDQAMAKAMQQDDELRANIVEARRTLPFVQSLTHQQLEYLCIEASAADCEGQRGEVFAAKIAQASAALQQRIVVNAQDLQLGVLLAIAPRARRLVGARDAEGEEESGNEAPPPPSNENLLQPLPPPPQQMPPTDQQEQEEQTEEETQPAEEEPEHEPADEETQPEEILIPEQFMFAPDMSAPVDPRVLQFQQWTRKGKKGKGSRIFNLKRGRFVKAVFPPPGMLHQGKIAVGATLRACAPFQKYRREHAKQKKLIYIRDDDIRIQRMKRKAGSLIIFCVDASGSMALNRMAAAKGAALTLLQEAYKSRDKIALIAFHDIGAEILVPPTKSMALASARLDAMPCGGRSPLAHAMESAMLTGLNAAKVKQDVGKVVIVLITDGRPTVPLCVSHGEPFDAKTMAKDPSDAKGDGEASRKFCVKEVYAIARQLGGNSDLDLLVIDTEDKFVATGVAMEISRLAQGTYVALDARKQATADIVAATRQHVEATRK